MKISEDIQIPEGIEGNCQEGELVLKGSKGENRRVLRYPGIQIEIADNKVRLGANKATKRELKIIKTFKAHIGNMISGVSEGHSYQLRICAGHFPMNVSMSKNEFIVKNFFGEKFPRKLKVRDKVTVKISGQDIYVESVDKELAGQTAADIEQLTRRTGFDRRIFQDGIYIVKKDGREIK
ncbi:MAG: 50S ribosomal protein L6 [archaeon]